ncbi:MAG: hypothetical protein ABR575_07860 [Actinomycetota bacterium]
MNRRAALLAPALLAGVLLPVAGVPGRACAASTGSRAALVVDTGAGVHRLCVELDRTRVSGLRLIELAGAQHGLDYRFGHGGAAVCRLAGVGTDDGDCFAEYPDFWGYWRGDGGGGWPWSGSGAGSTVVEDGDVEGWSWGSGNDGSTHPRPPTMAFASVCAVTDPKPSAEPSPESSGRSAGDGDAGDAGDKGASGATKPEPGPSRREPSPTGASPASGRDVPTGTRRGARAGRAAGPIAAASPGAETPVSAAAPALAIAPAQEPRRGPPPAGWVAIAAASGLALMGVRAARRRRPGPR